MAPKNVDTIVKYLEDILGLIVAVTAQAMESNICSLMLIDDKKRLVIRATQSMSEDYNKKPPLKLGEGIAGIVAKSNKPTVVKDITKEKERNERGTTTYSQSPCTQ